MGLNKSTFLIITVINLLFITCKKPALLVAPAATVIKPLPYLPCFPGSYWNYLDENNNSINYTTAKEYKLVKLHYSDSITLDPVKIPVFNNRDIFGYYDLAVDYRSYYNGPVISKTSVFFSEQLNYSWKYYTYGYDPRDYGSTLFYSIFKVSEVNKLIYNQALGNVDSVVVIKETLFQYGHPVYYEDTYYAKNIGIVRKTVVDSVSQIIKIKLELQSYFINL